MTASFDAILDAAPNGEALGLARIGHERLAVALTNYGARMLSIEAPDREGAMDHVLLGFDQPEMILKSGSFGCVLGRYANRIAGGRFTLDRETYQLSVNDGANTLHGGKAALGKQVWALVARDDLSATFANREPRRRPGFSRRAFGDRDLSRRGPDVAA